MPLCELCERPLEHGTCPTCGGVERASLLALDPRAFPVTAFPPRGLSTGGGILELRLALLHGDLGRAESLWDALLRTLRPLGAEGRRQLADCFEACAALKQVLRKESEAARLRQRALTLHKEPGDLLRHSMALRGPGWDSHPWTLAQGAAAHGPPSGSQRLARADLDRVEAASSRRHLLLGLGAGGFTGLWCAVVTGLPAEFLIPLGVLAGGLWARKP